MKRPWLLAIALSGAVAASAVAARADEVAAPVADKQIVWGQTANGQTANGLQMGLRFDVPNHVYRRGETAQFDLIVRNVGKTSVKFRYYSPIFPFPAVTDENGKPLKSAMKSPPPLGYPVGLATLALAPGAQTGIAQANLRLGSPIVPTLFWALDAPPGNYRVSFVAQLNPPFDSKGKRAPIALKSGFACIGIAAERRAEK